MNERMTPELEAELRKRVGMAERLIHHESGMVFAELDAVRAEKTALERRNAALVEAVEKIAGGLTDSDAPDIMAMGRDEFRGAMWSWSQRVARAALAAAEAGKEGE